MAGRPSLFTPEISSRICDAIAEGSNLSRICGTDEFPTRETVYQWLRKEPAFADDYARARETRADARFDRIDNVIIDLRAGTIDSNMARVEIDAIKWQAGKEAPNKYGDRTAVEHSGAGGAPLSLTVEFVKPKE